MRTPTDHGQVGKWGVKSRTPTDHELPRDFPEGAFGMATLASRGVRTEGSQTWRHHEDSSLMTKRSGRITASVVVCEKSREVEDTHRPRNRGEGKSRTPTDHGQVAEENWGHPPIETS